MVAGALGLKGEGWFDGPALLAAFRRRARSLGVTYVAQDAVGFERTGAAVRGVRLADGGVLPCDVAVNAAGPWSARVAGWLGIDLPVRARRRMVFVLACRSSLPGCPLVVDPTGVWFRPEGAGFICGRSPDEGEPDPDEPPLEVDEAEFTERMWPALAARVPAFEAVKITGAWAGYYELNLFDGNAVVGPHPGHSQLRFATGFSGHGIQHAPGDRARGGGTDRHRRLRDARPVAIGFSPHPRGPAAGRAQYRLTKERRGVRGERLAPPGLKAASAAAAMHWRPR